MFAALAKAIHQTRIILLITIILVLTALSACDGQRSEGSIELHTGGKVYQAAVNWVWSEVDGLAADGAHFPTALQTNPELKPKLEQAIEVPWAAEYSLVVVPQNASCENGPSLRFFDSQLEEISREGVGWSDLPEQPGIYYLVALYDWGSEGNRAGYEYIFKVRVPGLVQPTESRPLFIGTVEMDTQGKTYTACNLLLCQYREGKFTQNMGFGADTLRVDTRLQEKLEQAAAIPWSADIAFYQTRDDGGRDLIEQAFFVFSEQGEAIGDGPLMLDQLASLEPGLHYIVFQVEWGISGNYADYEYIFKIVRE